jgi:hypothetical protein
MRGSIGYLKGCYRHDNSRPAPVLSPTFAPSLNSFGNRIGMDGFSHGTPREHTAQPLPKLTGLLGTVRGLFRQVEAERNFEDRLKHSIL